MPNQNPTVFIVDRDASVRTSLEHVIRRAGWTTATFASADELLAHSARLIPSCLLLDLSFLDLDGFDLIRRIATQREETSIIGMSANGDIPMIVRAMQAGASEFLLKPLAAEVLRAAVGRALARSLTVIHEKSELLELRQRYITLSRREREVMGRVVAGSLNKQVGAALGISEITVKAHRGKAMRKMGAGSLPELVIMAMKLRLPSEPINRTSTMPRLRDRGLPLSTKAGALQTDSLPTRAVA